MTEPLNYVANPLETWPKDPDAILSYRLDWTEWLDGADTIASAAWSIPPGLTEDASANTTTTATVQLSGGVHGQSYYCRCRVTLASGEKDDRTVLIEVYHR